jgi:hypothetical protein
MIQNIIVVLLVSAAVVFVGYSVYRSVRPGNKSKSACGGCTGCELKNSINSCRETSVKTFSGQPLQAYPNRADKTFN